MHVSIPDQHVEREAADELRNIRFPALSTDDRSDIHRARPPILIVRIDAEDLREVLNVYPRPILKPVEALDRKRLPFECFNAFGKVAYGIDINEPDRRHVDADKPRQRHHRKFVLWNALEFARRKLDDPRAADALCRDRQSLALILDSGEFELDARKREPQSVLARLVPHSFRCLIVIGRPALATGWVYCDRTR